MHDTFDSRYSHIVPEFGMSPADARVLGTGMHVWEIAWTARYYDSLPEMAESLNLDRDLLREGMRYAEGHSEAVDAAVQANDLVALDDLRLVLPGLKVFSFENDASKSDRAYPIV